METVGVAGSCSTAANTTECLLNRLINIVGQKLAVDEGKTDWDPITFAFTVPVGVFGILATLLALIAIIQGIFAASPGRRKSSRQVIGAWAELTVTRVSLRELRTYTQATTPHFIARKLLSMLREKQRMSAGATHPATDLDPNNDNSGAAADNGGTPQSLRRFTLDWLRKSQSISWRLPLYSSKVLMVTVIAFQTPRMPSAEAGWLRLLSELGIADLLLDPATSADTAADYIPDDLRAVPAYADIHAIVVLAAVGGARSFEPETGSAYPLLIAPRFEIEFRQHPVLGRVAAFSGTVLPISPERAELIEALKHSNGRVELQEHLVRDSVLSDHDIPVSRPDHLVSRNIALHGRGAQVEDCYESSICRSVFHNVFSLRTESHILWLLAAKTPAQKPVLFPLHQVSIHTELILLCLQSRFWTSDKSLQDTPRFVSMLSKMLEGDQLGNKAAGEIEELQRFLVRLPRDTEYGGWTKGVIPVCVDFIHGNGQITSISAQQRTIVLRILWKLDTVMEAMQALSIARPRCQSTMLYVTTSMLFAFQQRFETEPPSKDETDWQKDNLRIPATSLIQSHLPLLSSLDRFLGKTFTEEDPDMVNARIGLLSFEHWQRLRKFVDQCKSTYQEGTIHEASVEENTEQIVIELLILRAILIGVLFCSAPDISTIQKSPIWGHVVPVL
ncbi:hypothetical protein G7054_g1979 [Neopestalotiopsis clavispora]|nr:hypothetical protein G7054_g1979 [Neopestalotiopsis clavispora]